MASLSLPLPFCCLLLLLPLSSFARDSRFYSRQEQCRLDRISGLQPRQRFESEAGVSEHFDSNEQQLQCAGVTVIRRTVNPGGLVLPSFSNSPSLIYIIEGGGIGGLLVPGCQETFQSFQEQGRGKWQEQGQQAFDDQHQKVYNFRQGDVIAVPAGFAHWCYNNGDRPVIAITVLDTSNNANQLDSTHRQFMLAGSLQKGGSQGVSGEQQSSGSQFLRAFDSRLLAEALGIPQELAHKIQREDSRGEMVMVKEGLKVIRPFGGEEQRERFHGEGEEEERRREKEGGRGNFLMHTICGFRLHKNIDDPRSADFFNPQAGWLTKLNSLKLPVLSFLQLSAKRVVMRPQTTLTPQWVVNAHCIMYVTKGRARVQVADDEGRLVHDGELRQGRLLVVPQNFVAIIRAEEEGVEWVSFETNDNVIDSPIAGELSVFKGLPVDVIANAYQLPREDAFKLKFGRRDEIQLFTPYSSEHKPGGPLLAA